MHKLGVLFDIDDLGGGLYGYAAYKIFFAAVNTRHLAGCLLRDGDTHLTLAGKVRHYCIAVESRDPSQVAEVKRALGTASDKGLLPLSERFLGDAWVAHEPLVLAAIINSAGELLNCETSWVLRAWREESERAPSTLADDKPLDGSGDLQAKDAMSGDGYRFVSAARAWLENLPEPARSTSLPWTKEEEYALFDFARSFLPLIDSEEPPRIYQEFDTAVRKELLLLVGLLPAISEDAARRGRTPLFLVTDFERKQSLRRAAEFLRPEAAITIDSWIKITDVGALDKRWILGDVDWDATGQFHTQSELAEWTANAMDLLVRKCRSPFILVHQIGQCALLPTGSSL
jgi:hypothetical protein